MQDLSREERVLLHLLRIKSNNELPPELLEQVDWSRVMWEARQQTVLLQSFDAAAAYEAWIPPDVYREWFLRASRILSSNAGVLRSQDELLTLLDAAGYSCLILKGAAVSAHYPRPELRMQGDVDFLIRSHEKTAIRGLLESAGYESSHHEHVCHMIFEKADAHLEMHFEIAGIPDGRPGSCVREFLADVMEHGAQVTSDGHTFRVPAGEHEGLILLLHMQHHMLGEGFGLRHLCDWAFFVEETGDQSFWNARLLPLLKEIGLFYYAAVITKTCARYLGSRCPDWAANAEDDLCREVLEDILSGGNFGRKDIARSRAGTLISDHGKNGTSRGTIYNLYRTLHRSTQEKYPIVTKIKLLHPLLDAVRAAGYMMKVVRGERTALTKLAPLAQERRTTYEKLHIFEPERSGELNER